MRTTRFAILALVCVAAGFPAVADGASPAAPSMQVAPGAEAKPSWTDRMTAPFKTNPLATLKAKMKPTVTKVEPIDEPFNPKKATPELYIGLAQMSERGGNIPQARELYQKALAKAPNHVDALLGAARMEDREGQFDVALMLYKRAAAAHPQNATVLNDLALCHARRGELPQAHQALEQAIRLEPQKPLFRNNVAKVLVELNAINPAMQNLSAVHPPATAHYNMAVLLTERGRQDEANWFLAQAVAIDPQLEAAHAMLAGQSGNPDLAAPANSADMNVEFMAPMLVQSAAPAPIAAAESILPTPEIVATVPWTPGSTGASEYPTTIDVPTPAAAPQPAITSPVPQMPALLPPVN